MSQHQSQWQAQKSASSCEPTRSNTSPRREATHSLSSLTAELRSAHAEEARKVWLMREQSQTPTLTASPPYSNCLQTFLQSPSPLRYQPSQMQKHNGTTGPVVLIRHQAFGDYREVNSPDKNALIRPQQDSVIPQPIFQSSSRTWISTRETKAEKSCSSPTVMQYMTWRPQISKKDSGFTTPPSAHSYQHAEDDTLPLVLPPSDCLCRSAGCCERTLLYLQHIEHYLTHWRLWLPSPQLDFRYSHPLITALEQLQPAQHLQKVFTPCSTAKLEMQNWLSLSRTETR